MSTDRGDEGHLGAEEIALFVEGGAGRRRRARVEEHLADCEECTRALAAVVRAARAPTDEERASLERMTSAAPPLAERLRGAIVASSPGSGETGRRGGRRRWALALAAVLSGLALLALVQTTLLAPARARRIAAAALDELVAVRQGTGRVPLRYLRGFRRAGVTRSAFDTPDPAERAIEESLRRAVALAPDEPSVRVALGLFLLDRGDLDGAEAELARALELDPLSVDAQNGLAVVYYERAVRDPRRADELLRVGLAHLRAALRLDPDDPQVAFNLGRFYQELGWTEYARRAWSAYVARDAGSEWARVALEELDRLGVR